MRAGFVCLVAVAALVTSAAQPFAAYSAAPTCQGETATIVDLDGGQVKGTDGNDVIYAAGTYTSVEAMGGDDKVCLDIGSTGYVVAGAGHDSVQARGTDENQLFDVMYAEDLDIVMGGGFDSVGLDDVHGGTGIVDAGPGEGLLKVFNTHSVDMDLEDEVMALDAEARGYEIRGFQDVLAYAPLVALEGDRQDNVLRVVQVACQVSIRAGRGHDELLMVGNGYDLSDDCEKDSPRLLGQRGNDKLQGRAGDDVLIGGLGRDVAKGSHGRDKCRAERTKNCER